MGECRRILDQVERSFRGPAWHGPSLRENLEGVTAAVASAKPIAGAHSIWEVVLHAAAWQTETWQAMQGKQYVSLAGDADWPPVRETGEDAWKAALDELDRAHASLCAAIENFPDERLRETVSGKDFSFYGLLHGLAQHNVYHAGQIAMLRKAQNPMAANSRE